MTIAYHQQTIGGGRASVRRTDARPPPIVGWPTCLFLPEGFCLRTVSMLSNTLYNSVHCFCTLVCSNCALLPLDSPSMAYTRRRLSVGLASRRRPTDVACQLGNRPRVYSYYYTGHIISLSTYSEHKNNDNRKCMYRRRVRSEKKNVI